MTAKVNKFPTLPATFVSQCFGCEHYYDDFELGFNNRRHDKKSESACEVASGWPLDQWDTLVSHLPNWKFPLDITVLPPVRRERGSQDADLFARWADIDEEDRDKGFPKGLTPLSKPVYNPRKLKNLFPYIRDHLAEQGWRCGSPLLWRSERIQSWIWHPQVFVLYMSTYLWSHTLKDLRTWAIINVACDHGFRHLAAWTAGNAGLSLAMLVRACNNFLPANERMRVYTLFDEGDTSVRDIVIDTLSSWECILIPVPGITSKKVFRPEDLRRKVRNRAVGLSGFESEEKFNKQYLESTDGWDIGIVMYRLLFAQVIRDLRPTHIVIPLGTGNLAIGAVLAVNDCFDNQKDYSRPRIYGAQPEGMNITNQIRASKDPWYFPKSPKHPPLMPKIANTYSPLKPCIDYALFLCLQIEKTKNWHLMS